ncbi:hypothetical protein ABS785_03090 [Mycoplasmopsis bovis]
MKSKIYIIMFSCFMLKLGNVGELAEAKKLVDDVQEDYISARQTK